MFILYCIVEQHSRGYFSNFLGESVERILISNCVNLYFKWAIWTTTKKTWSKKRTQQHKTIVYFYFEILLLMVLEETGKSISISSWDWLEMPESFYGLVYWKMANFKIFIKIFMWYLKEEDFWHSFRSYLFLWTFLVQIIISTYWYQSWIYLVFFSRLVSFCYSFMVSQNQSSATELSSFSS